MRDFKEQLLQFSVYLDCGVAYFNTEQSVPSLLGAKKTTATLKILTIFELRRGPFQHLPIYILRHENQRQP